MEYLTVKEVAEKLLYTDRSIRKMVAAGQIKGYRIGRKILIPPDELERLLSRTTVGVSNPYLSELIKANLQKHGDDLREEAGKIRDLIEVREFGLKEQLLRELDYPANLSYGEVCQWLGPPKEGHGTLLYRCLMSHLDQDAPKVSCEFLDWQERTWLLVDKVMKLRWEFGYIIHQEIENEKAVFERSNDPCPNVQVTDYFVESIWKEVVLKCLYQELIISFDDHKMWKKTPEGPLVLTFDGEEIAVGRGWWISQLSLVHKKLYHSQMDFLIGKFEEMNIFKEIREVELLANRVYEELDAVFLGGAMFHPGHCRICRALVD